MHTKNDLPEKTRQNVIQIFQDCLADGICLMLNAKQAHWNVKGDNFIALHELFDKINEELREHTDLMAERIAQLGGIAEGTAKAVLETSTLPDYPLDIVDSRDHVEALSDSIAFFAHRVRESIDDVTEMGDLAGADIFTEVSREIDKLLWFVESHLEDRRAGVSRRAA